MGSHQSSSHYEFYEGNRIHGHGNFAMVNHGSTVNLDLPMNFRLRRSAGFCPPTDEKFSVQTLDTCLLDYLSTVRSLEDANAKLELKIRQWVDSSGDSVSRDYSACFQTISIIRSKIQTTVQVYGSMGDAQTADEPLKNKSEKEPAALQSLEADVAELKKILDQLMQTRSDMKTQIQGLEEELKILKKNNQEVDLTKAMAQNAQLHDTIYSKNQKDLEAFQAKTQVLKNKVVVGIRTLQMSGSEVTQVQSTLQSLETQLQSTLDTEVLEGTLAETLSQYGGQLSGYLTQVTTLEEQLVQLRLDLDLQDYEYKKLLDTNIHLESEVAEYKRLQG
ncbi:keratin, type I cytoskeletal 13-like [Sphaeramia orbicularis]|uniref:keratin, type I cytoskeletal 13-like n=1 Tax=Sphaeramia orbicularis TaxID=375764 RepID=UPI00117C8FC5|nr:keratin, type I cytoskeletal 13-like [Sphaeramia orbicularis]XP_029996698.1 keratin, type I cytoskeletal 13-like [Sphaeramia orbicularis]